MLYLQSMCVNLLKNVVIMKSPHRHNLAPSSCVNNEVLKFNRQIEKKINIYNNVKTWRENTLLSMISI
jgi:hypothetical protein